MKILLLILPILIAVFLLVSTAYAGNLNKVKMSNSQNFWQNYNLAGYLSDLSAYKTEKIASQRLYFDDTVWPADKMPISSPFGPRKKASDGYRYDYHRGIDIPGVKGVDRVYAMADGEIYRTYTEGEPGNPYPNGGTVVVLKHKADSSIYLGGKNFKTYYSVYMHLDNISVDRATAGGSYKTIKKGDVLGTVGTTGTTEFSHLHFEVRVGTTCSREYQINNPNTSCAKKFERPTDPHVNPFLFLDYDDDDTIKAQILSVDPVKVKVFSKRDDLDFNEIKIKYGNKEKIINLGTREGVDPEDIDNGYYNGVKIMPAKFNKKREEYNIEFEFEDFKNFDYIGVKDIWGKGIKISK